MEAGLGRRVGMEAGLGRRVGMEVRLGRRGGTHRSTVAEVAVLPAAEVVVVVVVAAAAAAAAAAVVLVGIQVELFVLVLAHGGITAPTFWLVTACYCDCWGWGGRGGGEDNNVLCSTFLVSALF